MVEIRSLRSIRPDFKIAVPRRPDPDLRTIVPTNGRIARKRLAKDFPPPTPQPTPCRIWQGPLDVYGYGAMKRYSPSGVRMSIKAHRWVMEQATGRLILPHETVLHLCDNPPCFRVDHLRLGSIRENNADMFAKGRASPPPVNRIFGAANRNSKITPAQRVELYERFLLGETQYELAEAFGLSRPYVQVLLREFFRAPWAWQGMVGHLIERGFDPNQLLRRLEVHPDTRWDLFKPRDLAAEADLFVEQMSDWKRETRRSGSRGLRDPERTKPVKEAQDGDADGDVRGAGGGGWPEGDAGDDAGPEDEGVGADP